MAGHLLTMLVAFVIETRLNIIPGLLRPKSVRGDLEAGGAAWKFGPEVWAIIYSKPIAHYGEKRTKKKKKKKKTPVVLQAGRLYSVIFPWISK